MIWLLPWEDQNDVKHVHWVLYGLVALNVAVFLCEWFATGPELRAMFEQYQLKPTDPRWYQFISANFMHAGWMHLIGNMVFLCLFGDNVEDVLGPLGFLTLYLVGGVLGNLMWVSSNPSLAIGGIGASGCVATIAGAYAVMFFSQRCSVRVMLLVFPIWKVDLKAFWMLILWFASDIVQTFATRGHMDSAGVNFVVHAAGFFVGFMVAVFARMHGVMRRYELMPVGHGLFGYWPSDTEAAFKREKLMRARRERAFVAAPHERNSRHWR